MHFKQLMFIWISLVLVLTGCDRFLKSNKSNSSNVIKMDNKEFECLKTWPGQLKSYFQDQLSTAETAQIFTCVDGALGVFEKFTKGENPNQYSALELQEFINRYMLKNNQVSTAFMTQIMKIKMLMIGGSESMMTRAELARLHQLISLLASEGQALRGQWKVLLFDADPTKVSKEQIEQIKKLTETVVKDLVDFSVADQVNYSWDNFKNLLDEGTIFLNADAVMANLKKWTPLTDSVRNLFMGRVMNLKTKGGWTQAGLWTADVYALMAHIYYHGKNRDIESAETWANIIDFVDTSVVLLNTAPQMQRDKMLRAEDFDDVIDEMAKMNLLSEGLTAKIMKNTYRHVFAILKQGESLSGSSSIDWQTIGGLDQDVLDHFKLEYEIWKLVELQVVQNFKQKEMMSLTNIIGQWRLLDVRSQIETWAVDSADASRISQTWSDWLNILTNPFPLTFLNGTHLQIPTSPISAQVNAYSLTILNALRSMVRLVEMGYGVKVNPNAEVWDGMMSLATVQKWEADFKEFGQAIHFLDPRQHDSAARFYSDSRFFAFSSYGAAEVSSQQMLELISLMISGGKVVADELMEILKADKCLTTTLDPSFHKPMANQVCFEASLKRHFYSLFANLPSLLAEVKAGRISLDQVITQIEVISRDVTKPAGMVEFGEIRTMAGVLHYTEALMAVYDSDRNQLLSENELVAAFPRFQSVVTSVSPMGSWFSEDAYLYIVYRGKKPATDGFGSLLTATGDFASFVVQRQFGLPQVSRMNLLQVIAVLKQSTDAQNKAKGPIGETSGDHILNTPVTTKPAQ